MTRWLFGALALAACSGEPTPTDTGDTPATGDTGGPAHAGGLWASDPIAVGDVGRIVGGPEGWLLLDRSGLGAINAQRVAPDGTLVDAAPVELARYSEVYQGLWTGTEFAVLNTENENYYNLTATIELRRLPSSGPIAPVPERLGQGLGWPRDLVGACDGAGACVAALQDLHWLASPDVLRLSFDATGPVAPPAPIIGETRRPLDAVRDADRTVLALGGGAVAWMPDDPALPLESDTAVEGATIAASDDGTVLVAWSHYEGDGDSGLPAGSWSVRAQRVRYGEGVLDAAPIELGSGTLHDVAFTGTTFVVALVDEDVAHLVRVDLDGVAGDRIAVPQGPPDYGRLAAGAPGHLLWGRTAVGEDPFVVRVELDVPEGGSCSDAASCLSGACSAGVCSAAR